jgi:hypothetical protein
MTPAANFATSTAGVVDTSGKFVTSVNDTGGKFAGQGHLWHILGTISDCWRTFRELEGKKLSIC